MNDKPYKQNYSNAVRIIRLRLTHADGSTKLVNSHNHKDLDELVRYQEIVKIEVIDPLMLVPENVQVGIGFTVTRNQFVNMVKALKGDDEKAIEWVKWSVECDLSDARTIVDAVNHS